MKKLFAIVLVLSLVFSFTMLASAEEATVMSYDEYVAAAVDDPVVIEANIQAVVISGSNGSVSLFLQDADGGYYAYGRECTEEEIASFEIGRAVRISGYRAEWSGEIEIADWSYEFIDADAYVADFEDITDLLGKDEIAAKMNTAISFKGMTVEASKDAEDKEVAFLYNWDGSGEEGSDLYFNVSKDGVTYNFTVETDQCAAGSEVYEAVKALNIGDVIDIDAFLYWYNGINPHVTAVAAAN